MKREKTKREIKDEAEDTEAPNASTVELSAAPTGRAKCKHCEEFIEQDTMRVGVQASVKGIC